jgi:hypothetical protein
MTQITSFLHKYKPSAIIIEDIQNTSLFIISTYCFFSCLYYNHIYLPYDNPKHNIENIMLFDFIMNIIRLHAFIDLFINKSYDLIIHHILILGFFFYNNFYNISPEDKFILLFPLLKTEITSIFLCLKYWLPKKSIIYTVNLLLFYVSFFKFRIYDFYYEIIYNHSIFNIYIPKYSPSNHYLSFIFMGMCYGLYILNLYWFSIINRILYKTIVKNINININYDLICQVSCSYIHWLNIPLAIYIYSYNMSEKHILDIIGITCLSITSFKYHYDISDKICNHKIEEYDIPNKDNIELFFNDIIFINLRSFLAVVTNYYNNQYLFVILMFSGLMHLHSIYLNTLNIFNLLVKYDENKESFLDAHNIDIVIPTLFDIFLIIINSPIHIAIPYFLINIIISLLFTVKPFYRLTHTAFHILLIAETYYICLANST